MADGECPKVPCPLSSGARSCHKRVKNTRVNIPKEIDRHLPPRTCACCPCVSRSRRTCASSRSSTDSGPGRRRTPRGPLRCHSVKRVWVSVWSKNRIEKIYSLLDQRIEEGKSRQWNRWNHRWLPSSTYPSRAVSSFRALQRKKNKREGKTNKK